MYLTPLDNSSSNTPSAKKRQYSLYMYVTHHIYPVDFAIYIPYIPIQESIKKNISIVLTEKKIL